LKKGFRFGSFREALDFVNRVGELAEKQGHHPDVGFGWGWAEITVLVPRYKTLLLPI
jgi:4a-hydroxytetrahydrobiopterin dehydratase